MNHIGAGAILPFLVMAIIYIRQRGRASLKQLMVTPILMATGALWAIVPDLPRYAGRPDLYHRLAADPRSDLFFFHRSIDLFETDSPYYTVVVVLMVAALFAAAWRELRRHEEA